MHLLPFHSNTSCFRARHGHTQQQIPLTVLYLLHSLAWASMQLDQTSLRYLIRFPSPATCNNGMTGQLPCTECLPVRSKRSGFLKQCFISCHWKVIPTAADSTASSPALSTAKQTDEKECQGLHPKISAADPFMDRGVSSLKQSRATGRCRDPFMDCGISNLTKQSSTTGRCKNPFMDCSVSSLKQPKPQSLHATIPPRMLQAYPSLTAMSCKQSRAGQSCIVVSSSKSIH